MGRRPVLGGRRGRVDPLQRAGPVVVVAGRVPGGRGGRADPLHGTGPVVVRPLIRAGLAVLAGHRLAVLNRGRRRGRWRAQRGRPVAGLTARSAPAGHLAARHLAARTGRRRLAAVHLVVVHLARLLRPGPERPGLGTLVPARTVDLAGPLVLVAALLVRANPRHGAGLLGRSHARHGAGALVRGYPRHGAGMAVLGDAWHRAGGLVLARPFPGVRPRAAELAASLERPGRTPPDRARGAHPAVFREVRGPLVVRGAARGVAALWRRRRTCGEGQLSPPGLAGGPAPGAVEGTWRARGQRLGRQGGCGQGRGAGERTRSGQGGGRGGPPAGAPGVRDRMAGQLVAGPVPGHEPDHQGGGHRDRARAVGPGDKA